MTGTIHLIVEDETDVEVVRMILKAKAILVHIEPLIPTGGTGGISRLANQLDKLIRTALQKKKANDCIAVLHDADEQIQPNRTLYNQIKSTCDKYPKDVKLVIAIDEIEAWLLADGGLCGWLGERPRNCDSERQPSERLNRAVKDKTNGKKYSGRTRAQVLQKLDGSGDQHSESMRQALAHLHNAPCMRPN